MKKSLKIAAVLAAIGVSGIGAQALEQSDVIQFSGSDQARSTQGFETNELDNLLDPIQFGKNTKNTLFFSLNTAANEFGASEIGSGFRGGWAGKFGDLTPNVVWNYVDVTTSQTASEESLIEVTKTNFDPVTSTYASIVSALPASNLVYERFNRKLLAQIGLGFKAPFLTGASLQFKLVTDTYNVHAKSYSDTYTDTINPSESTLTSRGNRDETVLKLRNSSNSEIGIDLEPEFGLDFGFIKSRVTLPIQILNPFGETDTSVRTVTATNGGSSITALDSTTVTTRSGAIGYNGSSVVNDFNVGSSSLSRDAGVRLGITAANALTLSPGISVEIPMSFLATLYPQALNTRQEIVASSYNDVSSLLTGVTTTTDTVTLDEASKLSGSLGGLLRYSKDLAPNVKIHLGAGLDLSLSSSSLDISARSTTRTQVDGNNDGAFGTAGVDSDITIEETGYASQSTNLNFSMTIKTPLAISYSPTPILNFHAGTRMAVSYSLNNSTLTTEGDSNFIYSNTIDNLAGTNNTTQNSGSNSITDPVVSTSGSLNVGSSSSFGVTVTLTESLKIDALGTTSNFGFSGFSLTAVYSY